MGSKKANDVFAKWRNTVKDNKDEKTVDALREEEPRWVKNGTDHVHEHNGYTLIYNSTIGGVYMLYREATESEIEDYLTSKKYEQIFS